MPEVDPGDRMDAEALVRIDENGYLDAVSGGQCELLEQ